MERLGNDERGLVGKSIIVMMLLMIVIGVGVVDTMSILFTRLSVNNVASEVAIDAARAYRAGHSLDDAKQAAEQTLKEHPDMTLVDVTADRVTGAVTITIRKRASTLVAGKVSFLKKYANVRVTVTQEPPTV